MRNRKSLILALIALMMFTALPCLAADDAAKPLRHDFPRVGPYEVITGDFHMHTIFSDGKLTPRQRVEESYKWGYDAIAVTDHGKIGAYRVAKYVGEPLGMVIIRGFETGIAKNEHLVVLNVPYDHKPVDAHVWAEKPGEAKAFYQDQLNGIAKAGGLVIYPHPHVGYREPVLWGVKQGIIQGIELKNGAVGKGWNTIEDHSTYWYPHAVDFAMQQNLAVFANSDVHGNRAPETSPVTLLMVSERSVNGVMDAIRNQRTAAWFANMLWGREKLLTDMLAATVKVSNAAGGKYEIENLGPVPLKGIVLGKVAQIPDQNIELPAYGKASVDPSSTGDIKIKWFNVWTGLKDNLTTKHLVR